jgi:hypothetical protein
MTPQSSPENPNHHKGHPDSVPSQQHEQGGRPCLEVVMDNFHSLPEEIRPVSGDMLGLTLCPFPT